MVNVILVVSGLILMVSYGIQEEYTEIDIYFLIVGIIFVALGVM